MKYDTSSTIHLKDGKTAIVFRHTSGIEPVGEIFFANGDAYYQEIRDEDATGSPFHLLCIAANMFGDNESSKSLLFLASRVLDENLAAMQETLSKNLN